MGHAISKSISMISIGKKSDQIGVIMELIKDRLTDVLWLSLTKVEWQN